MSKRIISILLPALIFLVPALEGQVSFPAGSQFKYLKGSQAAGISSAWKDPGFDDSSWATGVAPFRYGDGSGGTVLDDMIDNYSTMYFRTGFEVLNADNIFELDFYINYDDGFIIWINGYEILSKNEPASPTPTSFATIGHESGSFESYTVNLDPGVLKEGTNLVAVQGFNLTLGSSDFYMDLSMSGEKTLPEYPDSLGITFSHPSGYYSSEFSLALSYPDPSLTILYTLDGSNPQDSPSAISLGTGGNIYIDPSSTANRPLTPAVTVRAAVVKDEYRASKPQARTYIYLENVKVQSYPGGAWPSSSVNGQAIDLDMDTRIVNHVNYRDQFDDAFMEIPTISVITDLKNLFDPVTGIYVNAMEHGVGWERESSVELICPDGTPGFNVNCGLRIRGGWSRHDEFAKHAFRLLFKGIYGVPKLRYPLFGEEGVDHFDNVDLRTAQNYAWSNGYSNNTMVREVFSRDLQGDMDQPYTRSRYYHLFLNGMYWGLFQTQERSEASYASDYLGGDEDEYDVVKVSTDMGYVLEATDGNLDGWRKIYSIMNSGLANNTNYFKLLGCDSKGEPVPGGEVLLDIDNLIDYMLTIFYAGNFDAPTSSFGQNKGPNNFYCINNREYFAEGFKFFNHDGEHALFSYSQNPGTGLYEDRVNLGTRTDYMQMSVSSFEKFHPQWLHFKLTNNEEYRQRFIDRAWLHMSEGGSLTPEKCLERFNKRVYQIDTAIIAESARWGDARGTAPCTRNEDWIPELKKVTDDFIPYRTDIVKDQLLEAGLYTTVAPPQYFVNSTEIGGTSYHFNGSVNLKIRKPSGSSILYYTEDGTDPRMIGGSLDPEAKISNSSEITVDIQNTMVITARTYQSGNWSALKKIDFLEQNEDYSGLKITELYFHPPDVINGPDTISGKRYEFIELKNTGDHSLNLSGLRMDSAVEYTFPEPTILGAGEFYVLVSKPTTFYNSTGLKPSGNYEGFLENLGDEILLMAPDGSEIIHFSYATEYPWPESASGTGYSIVPTERNPVEDPSFGFNWVRSKNIGGSPFSDEPWPDSDRPVLADGTRVKIYPNPATGMVNIEFSGLSLTGDEEVRIYSITGSLLYKDKGQHISTVNLTGAGISAGIYILQVSTAMGTESFRLVVE